MSSNVRSKRSSHISAIVANSGSASPSESRFLAFSPNANTWAENLMETLLQDLRFGVRTLLKNPGVSAIAILALALGTGANSAIFSVVNAIMLRPLPYGQPERLVMMWGTNSKSGISQDSFSVPNILDYREQNSTLEQIAAYSQDDFNMSTGGEPIHCQGAFVTANYFSVLGLSPNLGRPFVDGEDQSRATPVVIISDGLWRRQFGADPNILNTAIQLNGASFNLIGVMGPGFQSPNLGDELWATIAIDGGDRLRIPSSGSPEQIKQRNRRFLTCVARLKPGTSIGQAQSDVSNIASRLEQQFPNDNSSLGVNLVPMHKQVVGDIGAALAVLIASVGAVLLIACGNVANLLLARAAGRQKEIAIRTALGAARSRIIRQLLTESVLLGFAGGLLGLGFAFFGIKLLVALNPPNIPRLNEINIDLRVLGFTIVISLLTGLIFGLAPALQASKPNLNEMLKEGARGSSVGGGQHIRRLLVVLEMLLTTVLLITVGLMIRSFVLLQGVNPGFNAQGALTMWVSLPASKYSEDKQLRNFYQQAVGRIENLPGVSSVGVITSLPLTSNVIARFRFTIDGRAPATPNERLTANYRAINYDYFRTMGISLRKGRTFTEQDNEQAPPVVIVNETMAKRFWESADEAVGRRMTIPSAGNASREVVGVVADVKHASLDADSGFEFYVPYPQKPFNFINIIVRTPSDPMGLARSVREAVLAADPTESVYEVKTLQQVVSDSLSQPRLYTVLLSIFAAVALVLAAVGIYGVMNNSVSQRIHEIGIRLALGAQRSDILKMVVGQGMILALIGIALGLAAAFVLTRFMESLLFGVSARDFLTFLMIPAVLAIIAFLSTFIPAMRATRVDPMVALRYE